LSKSKNFLQKNCTFTYRLLNCLNWDGYYRSKELSDILKVGKQLLRYYLKKYEKEKFIVKVFRGSYKITESGKKFLRELDELNKKDSIRLENMRYKFPINYGVKNIIEEFKWEKKTNMKNVTFYHGVFEGYTIRLFYGKNPSIEISCKQWYGTNIHQIMWESRDDVEIVMSRLGEKYGLGLGKSQPSMKPDFAIPSKLSESILKSYNLSQLKSSKMVLNKSDGRNYDWETHDIESAQLVLDLPYSVTRIERKLDELVERFGSFQKVGVTYPLELVCI
jgi:DNA-binding PadR family transcriptional regulator